ncbi:hypothetical protein D9O40_02160 [Clostridium autoethanogenum]|uniref:Lipoprotein n=1 Tax=Clostridium autoethanogenum TaxID=84023 RepID=A0A3M0T0W6_9CLOT|nr:hypothetical protein D9O40_02160 [Clostridium autoethanogenum]
MKKLISILLICPLLLIGCSSHNGSLDSSNKKILLHHPKTYTSLVEKLQQIPLLMYLLKSMQKYLKSK